jgi:hypothetical protein
MKKLQSAAVAVATLAAAGLIVVGATENAATAAPAHSTRAATVSSGGGSVRAECNYAQTQMTSLRDTPSRF